MFRSETTKSLLLSFVLTLTALVERSVAEPMLIVELQNRDSCFDCAPTGTPLYFGVTTIIDPGGISGTTAEWSDFATATDVGKTFLIPPNLLPVFNTVLTYPQRIHGTLSLFGDFSHGFVSPNKLNFTDTGTQLIFSTRVAPNLGPNLAGYRLTNITQTIDELQYTNITPSRFRGTAAHTIRIYGEAIPEPSGLLHVAIVSALIASRICFARRKLNPVAGNIGPRENL